MSNDGLSDETRKPQQKVVDGCKESEMKELYSGTKPSDDRLRTFLNNYEFAKEKCEKMQYICGFISNPHISHEDVERFSNDFYSIVAEKDPYFETKKAINDYKKAAETGLERGKKLFHDACFYRFERVARNQASANKEMAKDVLKDTLSSFLFGRK